MFTFLMNERGATAIEYSIIAVATCLGTVFMLADISSDTNSVIESFITALG